MRFLMTVNYICAIGLLLSMSLDMILFFNARKKAKKAGLISFVQDNGNGTRELTGGLWLFLSVLNFISSNPGLAAVQLVLGAAHIEQGIIRGVFVTEKGFYFNRNLKKKHSTGNYRIDEKDGSIRFYIENASGKKKKRDKILFRFENTQENREIFRDFINGNKPADIFIMQISDKYRAIMGAAFAAVTAVSLCIRYAPPEILPPCDYIPYSEYERFDTKTVYSFDDIPPDCRALLITSDEKEKVIVDEDQFYANYTYSTLLQVKNITNDHTDDSFYEYKLVCGIHDAEGFIDRIADMDLIRLGFHAVELENIDKISYMENLEYLYIYGTYNNDTYKQMPLKLNFKGSFPALKELTVTGCDFKSIGNIKKISTLERLNIPDNELKSLSGIEKLKNLSRLNISLNHGFRGNIKSLSPLRRLTGLTALSAAHCIDGDELFSDLKYLENIEILDISRNYDGNIKLDFMKNYNSLRMLNAIECSITDISPFQNLTNLEYLDLTFNNIGDISALKNMTGLTYLSVYNNAITDMSAVSGCKDMETLYIGNNPTADISFVSELKNIKELNARIMPISDISPVSEIKGIEQLDISNTRIEDISRLSECSNIRELYIKSTEISDISAVSSLTLLENLSLDYGGNILDISALSECTALKRIGLSGTKYYLDYSPLYGLPELEEINIGYSTYTLPELKEHLLHTEK